MTDQTKMFASINIDDLMKLFDHLVYAQVWVKDLEGRYVSGNRVLLDNYKLRTLDDLIGKTDYDVSPSNLADHFVRDDLMVLSGKSINQRRELLASADGDINWFVTSKCPVHDENGEIIGTMGHTRHISAMSQSLEPYQQINPVIRYIQRHFSQNITLSELAEVAHLSVSALERRFNKLLQITPIRYVRQVRLEEAGRLLIETDTAISVISGEVGYNDHSYFTKDFHEIYGLSPSAYRDKYRKPEKTPK